MKHPNIKQLYRILTRLTKSEIIILLNYLLTMSKDLNEYTASMIALTKLLCRNYKTFLCMIAGVKNEILRLIVNGVIWVKKEFEIELVKRGNKDE